MRAAWQKGHHAIARRLAAAALTVVTATPAVAGPELPLEDLSGRPRNLAALRGKVVIVNFWATWCRPCREELPMLERLHREYRSRDVELVGASADQESSRARIPETIDETGVTFPIWVGATTADMERLGMGSALPATAILDRDGSIAFRMVGPLDEHDVRERIDWLLGARGGAQPLARIDTFGGPAHAGGHPDETDTDHADDADGDHRHDHGHDHAHDHAHDHGHDHGDGAASAGDVSLVPS